MPALDVAIADVARGQHGCFNRRQLRAAGATSRQIEHRLATGEWIQLERAVYAIASSPETFEQLLMAAALGRTRAIVSGAAAAALHGLPGFRRAWPELSVPQSGSARSELATVHRRSDFTAIAATAVDGIPVATVAETLFDISFRSSATRLQRAMDHALVTDATSVAELHDVLERIEGSRLKGTVAFREAVIELDGAYVPTQSETERMLFAALDDPRVPPIERQARLSWWEELPHRVDAYIADWMLILEADSRTYHTKREDFESDRRRDNLAAAHGYRVMRFTYAMLRDHPDQVLDLVLRAGRVRL
jgi:very-short-patch-repair endonuclease